MVKIDDARTKMQALRHSLNNELAAINGDTRYSESGRRFEAGKARLRHRRETASLKEQFTTTVARRRGQLERELFGMPNSSEAVSYRDAVDRVDAVSKSPEKLNALLASAIRSGDTVMVRAIGGHAYTHQYNGVLDTIRGNMHDLHGVDLDELRGLPDEQDIKVAFMLPGSTDTELSAAERADIESAVEANA